ncbi:DUF1523 family protein [Phaeobacter sp. HF9A]|uniref:DUF1523 family protein n=1 Tax=Phaeobacter sp. HF9A TaxID=2721561 RepID=UPI0014312575|nr:DUF1523 family protein [Phaeobacter sp. HF9A]NIZ13981.1 DUF1523 family protein [Phaeobacter sp. HF9A]
MAYVKWFFILTFWLCVGGFLHYTLPQYDVVRIVNTYEKRQQLGDWTRIFWSTPDNQSNALDNRDVQFISAVRPDDSVIVYRNEDTGWSWPPYFKFDSADLYTEANDAISTKEDPEWVRVMHYGWRNEFLSAFPNAISITPAAGPDDKPVNWISITILVLLAAMFWAIYVRLRRFKRNRIDPLIDNVEDGFYAAGDAIENNTRGVRRWFRRKPR